MVLVLEGMVSVGFVPAVDTSSNGGNRSQNRVGLRKQAGGVHGDGVVTTSTPSGGHGRQPEGIAKWGQVESGRRLLGFLV
ncbi:uncharacterized protein J3R85_008836 [Psidium guajava]|nr:uncharacterized protein J3R85_008836 [Psidium guajava]